ncbi:MAG TPA: von Willebrand factor type A domain-containing protein [Pirellulales bacterium]|nr:von Willebrand factor type A domain-containing protein [Pirellulales bacterium]
MNDQDALRDKWEDRLAEQALGELLGGKQPPDLAERILAAAQPVATRRRPRRRLALAASVAIIGGLAGGVYGIYRLASNDEHVTVGKRSGDPPQARAEDKVTASASARTVEPQEAQGEKLALLIDEFDKLMSEHRYAEAELVAGRAREQAPDEPVVKQMNLMVKMVNRTGNYRVAAGRKGKGLVGALHDIDESAIQIQDRKPFAFSGVEDWKRLTRSRKELELRSSELTPRMLGLPDEPPILYPDTEAWRQLNERRKKYENDKQSSEQVQQSLRQQIDPRFREMPLAKIADEISKLLKAEIHFDPQGLDAAGVTTDTPVTLELSQEISIKSALKLILWPLHLDYVIEGNKIKITSEMFVGASSNETQIMAALDDTTELDFVDQPLSDVIEYLRERHGVEIQVDGEVLADSGVGVETPITRSAKGITLRSALRQVLEEKEWTYLICGKVLMITSNAKAKRLPTVQQNRAGDLVLRSQLPDEGRGSDDGGDRYSRIIENPFLDAAEYPLSTFSIDVDTASFAKVRRYLLQENMLPPPDAVRIEELINYFSYELPQPEGKQPLAARLEAAACPWQPQHRLLRVSLKAREMNAEARPAANLVFLLDVSGSMQPDDKLPRVRRALRLLTEQLREQDRVAIVVYAGSSGLVLPSTPGIQKEKILSALESLEAGGSTNGGEGIELAYETAAANFIQQGANRVILCTDGDFNVGVTSDGELERLIEDKAKSGVFLTVLGFGIGNHNDQMLEKLADKGNGNYGYVDSEAEARKLLVEQAGGTLVTVAKDVKLQLEFNPRRVAAYRLIGYEDRLLRAEDFNDDRKDAGEIGAGHAVTAIYELIPAGKPTPMSEPEPLKYQRPAALTAAADSDELATLKVKYKAPDSQTSGAPLKIIARDEENDFAKASADFKFAAAVASFGMLLRNSEFKGDFTYDAVLEIAQEGLGGDIHGYRHAFLEMVQKAKTLAEAESR